MCEDKPKCGHLYRLCEVLVMVLGRALRLFETIAKHGIYCKYLPSFKAATKILVSYSSLQREIHGKCLGQCLPSQLMGVRILF